MVDEVLRCLAMETTVCHESKFKSDPLRHIQSVELMIQKFEQSAIKVPHVSDHVGSSVKHLLQLKFISNFSMQPFS